MGAKYKSYLSIINVRISIMNALNNQSYYYKYYIINNYSEMKNAI